MKALIVTSMLLLVAACAKWAASPIYCDEDPENARGGECNHGEDWPGRENEPPDPETPEKPDKPTKPEKPVDKPPVDKPPVTKPPKPPEVPKPPPHKPKPPKKPGQNPGNDKPVGQAPYDGERGEEPSGKSK